MKAHHKILAIWLACIAGFFGAAKIFAVLDSLDFFREPIPQNDDDCVRILSIGFSEDQTKFNNNSLLATDWKVLEYTPGTDRPGAIYAVSGFQNNGESATPMSTKSFVEDHLKTEKLNIVGYPEGVDFHPHGMYIHKPDDTLYVINHAYDRGGERIDVFEIGTTSEDVPNGLRFKYSITSDWMKTEMNGILNSLVVVEPNKFYVTQYHAEAQVFNEGGWLTHKQQTQILMAGTALFKPKATFVWYCEYSENSLHCRKVADGFVMANGMTHNPDYSKIFVADSMGRTVTVFDRDASTNNLSGRTTIGIASVIDNIKFDDVSGNVYGGLVTNFFQTFKNHRKFYQIDRDDSFSSVLEISGDENANADGSTVWSSREVLTTSKLNCATNGMRMNNYYVLGSGSVGYKGLLVCPVVDLKKEADVKAVASETSEL